MARNTQNKTTLIFAILRSGLLGAIEQGFGCDMRLFAMAAQGASRNLVWRVIEDIEADIGAHNVSSNDKVKMFSLVLKAQKESK